MPTKPKPLKPGYIQCEVCNGDGANECEECAGAGTNVIEYDQGYEHERDCSNCEGSGTLDCNECDGMGQVADPNLKVDDDL